MKVNLSNIISDKKKEVIKSSFTNQMTQNIQINSQNQINKKFEDEESPYNQYYSNKNENKQNNQILQINQLSNNISNNIVQIPNSQNSKILSSTTTKKTITTLNSKIKKK